MVSLSAHIRASVSISLDETKPKVYEWSSEHGTGKRLDFPMDVSPDVFSVDYDRSLRMKRSAEGRYNLLIFIHYLIQGNKFGVKHFIRKKYEIEFKLHSREQNISRISILIRIRLIKLILNKK